MGSSSCSAVWFEVDSPALSAVDAEVVVLMVAQQGPNHHQQQQQQAGSAVWDQAPGPQQQSPCQHQLSCSSAVATESAELLNWQVVTVVRLPCHACSCTCLEVEGCRQQYAA